MSGAIEVGRVGRPKQGFENIRVDRRSVLGNPFYMKSESLRDNVCNQFEKHFEKEIQKKGSPFHQEMVRIFKLVRAGKKVNVQCHCYPKRCHANTVARFIESKL